MTVDPEYIAWEIKRRLKRWAFWQVVPVLVGLAVLVAAVIALVVIL